ncbi:hypothetical protein BCR35DRAFT_333787 [Leucosporidium creatinivorum]|uniref:Chitin-binding type-2 domain-containing protein n=1 Tax=Leucosporidium creatinivorum TaxID=106004 RepID=A0A1Y2END4_9BASI|nr:hypothetical protein BCR35DRAFT_333787 [Leucosporidium creatinivorum]
MLPTTLSAVLLSLAASASLVAAGPIPELAEGNYTESASVLLPRAVSCTKTSQCSGIYQAPHSHYYCNPKSKKCQYNCNSGYTYNHWTSACTKNKGTSSSTASTSNLKVAATSGTTSADLSTSAFKANTKGWNTGAIASWFDTSSSTDSTNGNSWCWYPYDNNVSGFAPSLKTMLDAAGGDETAARKMWCGLEATVTTPDGRTSTLYIADAFDDTWVRTPNSIDVVHNAFNTLYGSSTNNKDDVIQNVKWQLTGRRSIKYKYDGAGSA